MLVIRNKELYCRSVFESYRTGVAERMATSDDRHTHSYSLKTKLTIAGVSLLIALLALEVGLRIAGHVYLTRHIPAGQRADEFELDSDAVRVLCLGDSFTMGSKVPPDGTYPHYLSVFLNENTRGQSYQVVNQGVCEYNSWQLLQFLPTWIDKYKPHIVCLLVGSSNRFNPWGYEFQRQDPSSLRAKAQRAFRSLRTVKMLHIMTVNLKGRLLALQSAKDAQPAYDYGLDGRLLVADRYGRAKQDLKRFLDIRTADPESAWTKPWAIYNQGDKDQAITLCRGLIDDAPDADLPTLLCSLGYFLLDQQDYKGADAAYRRALELRPSDEFVLRHLAFFHSNAGRGYIRKGDFGEAIEHLFLGIQLNPHDEYLYYAMCKAYELQSNRDAATIVRRCRDLLEENPSLEANQKFMNHIRMFENYNQWEDSVREWLHSDLVKIVDTCKSKGIEVILQNYPIGYPLANAVLAKVAKEKNLPFVDHATRFAALVAADARETYFLDDDHCTARGHREMARNVQKRILQAGLGGK